MTKLFQQTSIFLLVLVCTGLLQLPLRAAESAAPATADRQQPSSAATPTPPPAPGMRPPQNGEEEPMPPEVREFFEKLQKENPAEYQRLIKLRLENREQFMQEMMKLLPNRNHEMNKKLFETERECWEIARQLRQTPPPANAEELKKQLQAKISATLDVLVENTQERLNALQKRLDTILKHREDILGQRLEFFLKAPLPPDNMFKEQPGMQKGHDGHRFGPPPPSAMQGQPQGQKGQNGNPPPPQDDGGPGAGPDFDD